MNESYPRQMAETARFTRGKPRGFQPMKDGNRVLFLRSNGGRDPVLRLWELDLSTGRERLLVDPSAFSADQADLPAAERARRERLRESASGITSFSTDVEGTRAVFTLAGHLHAVDLATGDVTEESAPPGVFDPRISADGTRVAFVVDGALHVHEVGSLTLSTPLVADDDPNITWGLAEFVAAEEFGRTRGFWWSPDGTQLLVARVDNNPVQQWSIADPANPQREAVTHRYPAAGTDNAIVQLFLVDPATGEQDEVTWDRDAFEYLAAVRWDACGPPLALVMSRDQRRQAVVSIGAEAEVVAEITGEPWVDVPHGAPRWLPDGRLVTVVDDVSAGRWGSHRLAVDGDVLTPEGLQVRSVVAVVGEDVWFTASGDDSTEVHVHVANVTTRQISAVTVDSGVHTPVVNGSLAVVVSAGPDSFAHRARVMADRAVVASIASNHETPIVEPRIDWLTLGPDGLRAALLLPTGHDGRTPLPVLLDPYGGPGAQRVLASRQAFATSQWWADQGFAVLVCDGRGTPGRGPGWAHRLHGDFATGVLDDQIAALEASAAIVDFLDLNRVGIRGWSYGGYLAALAVLRRPDVFHAGVAGAPVTDWHLYDTGYTERFIGTDPAGTDAEAYRASSLVGEGGLIDAAEWDPKAHPKLLIIHGMADDNVVAAHSLRLSGALLAEGRPHQFLPLTGVTHMTPQAEVTENLALLERDFLVDALRA